MGIMDISAPRVKKPIPMTRRAAPARNSRIVPAGMGTRTTLATSTIAVMGSTEEKASIIFSFSILFMDNAFLYLVNILVYFGGFKQ
jgi:hypothetical protein